MDKKQAQAFINKIAENRSKQIKNSPNIEFGTLVKQWFDDPSHVLPEMLQNADDEGATTMRIDLNDERILIQNNGKKFTKKQIESICSIGLTTKKVSGYIGMYGVGFKSVFAVSDKPKVHSGNYSFCFDEETLIVPHWVPPVEEYREWNTTINLPLKDKRAYESLKNQLVLLEQNYVKPLLFLRKIRELDVTIGGSTVTYSCEESASPLADKLGAKIMCIKKNDFLLGRFCVYRNNPPLSKDLFEHLISERHIQKKEKEKLLKQTPIESEICISFRVSDDGHILPNQEGLLFAFLPTKIKTYLPFDINADFILNPTRDGLNRTDDPYNLWLCKEAANTIIKLIPKYKDRVPSEYYTDFYNLLPCDVEERETYLEEQICKPIIDYVKTNQCFLTKNPLHRWVLADEVVEAPGKIRTLLPSIFEILQKYYLSDEIKTAVREFLAEKFGIQKIGIKEFLDWLSGRDIVTGRNTDWLFELFVYLGEEYERTDHWEQKQFLDKVRNCYLIPAEGNFVLRLSETSKPVYRAKPDVPLELLEEMFILRQDLFERLNKEISGDETLSKKVTIAREFLWELVDEASPKRILEEVINRKYEGIEENEIKNEKENKLLNDLTVYLKRNSDKLDLKKARVKLRVKDKNLYKSAAELYLCNDYLKDVLADKLIYDIEYLGRGLFDFVSPDYLFLELNVTEEENIKNWRDFLVSLGVKDCITLEKNEVGSAKSTEEFLSLLETRKQKVDFQLKGSGKPYMGIYDYSMKGKAYELYDWDFHETFASLLRKKTEQNDIRFFEQLLKMLDFHWEKLFREKAQPYYRYALAGPSQSVGEDLLPGGISEFGKWLRETAWFPAQDVGKKTKFLAQPIRTYLFTSETASIKDALYVNPDEIRTESLRQFLGIKTKAPVLPIELLPEDKIDTLLEEYRKIEQKSAPIRDKERTLIEKLYRKLNNHMKLGEPEPDFLSKLKQYFRRIPVASGEWREIESVRYYVFDHNLLEKMLGEVKREIVYLPNKLSPKEVRVLLETLGIEEMGEHLERKVVYDEFSYREIQFDYFIALANAILSFLSPQEGMITSEIEQKCKKLSELRCYHTSALKYRFERASITVSQLINTDAILLDDKLWFVGDLSDHGVEIAKEITALFRHESDEDEMEDFIQKVFARSENYIEKLLRSMNRDYKKFFVTKRPKVEGAVKGQRIMLTDEDKKKIEKNNIEKIIEYEAKNGRKATDVSGENKGYDIESISDKERRFIEVKSASHVEITDPEYHKAEELSKEYWLYVVVSKEPFRLCMIQNPFHVCQVEKSYIEIHWKVVDWQSRGEEIEIQDEDSSLSGSK